MNVLYLYPIYAGDLAELRRQLHPAVALAVPPTFLDVPGSLVGESPPTDLRDVWDQVPLADVFVADWARPDILAQATRLRTFIVPYAGLSTALQATLRQFPQLTVYNSHFNATPVAEHAWALFMAVAKRVVECDRKLRLGDWTPRYAGLRSILLRGRTAGIVGYGAVGRAIAELATGWGMRVRAVRRQRAAADPDFVGDMGQLGELLAQSDVIFVCLPLTDETRGLIDEAALRQMKPTAIVVNVSRGPVVEEDALYRALSEGWIWGAGIDTWYIYPSSPADRTHTLPSRYPFESLSNVTLSPHRAAAVDEVETLRVSYVADLLNRLACGAPMPDPVDVTQGY